MHVRDSMYECTRQMLDSLEANDNNIEFTDIEHVQARILLVVYDFMRTSHQRGWISAGRCFRLVQFLRLCELDSPENLARRKGQGAVEDWVGTEVKRRSFWVAYSLDRFISIRHQWPLTLNEQDVSPPFILKLTVLQCSILKHVLQISTRLPAPEKEFQSGQSIEMPFFTEGINSMNPTSASPFTECIVLATICGRSLAHRRQSMVEHVYSQVTQQFWERHEWLYAMLEARYDGMLKSYPAIMQQTDCMLLFTIMIAQTTVLQLCKVMESVPWENHDCREAVMDFKERSLHAAKEIVTLTRALHHLSYFKASDPLRFLNFAACSCRIYSLQFSQNICLPDSATDRVFKVHPFTPLPLSLCVDFLSTHRYLDESANLHIEEVLNVLRELSTVNNLARDYLLDEHHLCDATIVLKP